MVTIGKKTKYKVHLLNEMENATECHYLKNEKEFNDMIYSLADNRLFKSYIGGGLYCWHKKLG